MKIKQVESSLLLLLLSFDLVRLQSFLNVHHRTLVCMGFPGSRFVLIGRSEFLEE